MKRRRQLSPYERVHFSEAARFGAVPVAGMPLFIGSTVAGEVDETVVRRVLTELAAGHPLLRCRVVEDSGGDLSFLLREDFVPDLDTYEGGEQAYGELINSPQNWAEHGLFRAVLLRDTTTADTAAGTGWNRLVLVIHHGVADGRSAFALLDELWRRYTAHAEGAGLPVRVGHDLPEAVDARLAETVPEAEVTALLDQLRAAATAGAPPPATLPLRPDGDAPRPFALDRITFDEAETAALAATARAQGMTFNGLLCGAALTAVRAQLPYGAGAVLPMVCGHAADLRPQLGFPAATVLNCVSGFGTYLPVPAAPDPLALGRAIHAAVRRALESGAPARFLLAQQRARSATEVTALSTPPSLAVSNVGRVPSHPTPPGLRIVRDEAYAMASGMPPKLTAFTYGGRLTVQVEYETGRYGRELMGRVGEELESVLRSMAETDRLCRR